MKFLTIISYGLLLVISGYFFASIVLFFCRLCKSSHNKNKPVVTPETAPTSEVQPNATPYGLEFSLLFSHWLQQNKCFFRNHPYAYCSGFEVLSERKIIYAIYSDGYIDGEPIRCFANLNEFCQWLSEQSDALLDNKKTLPVSYKRMIDALQGNSCWGY